MGRSSSSESGRPTSESGAVGAGKDTRKRWTMGRARAPKRKERHETSRPANGRVVLSFLLAALRSRTSPLPTTSRWVPLTYAGVGCWRTKRLRSSPAGASARIDSLARAHETDSLFSLVSGPPRRLRSPHCRPLRQEAVRQGTHAREPRPYLSERMYECTADPPFAGQIVERLVNSLMMKGRNNGKKLMAVRIVAHAFEIVHLLTDQNPIQVLVDAIVSRPRARPFPFFGSRL